MNVEKATVFVLEDDPDTRNQLRALAPSVGVAVEIVASGPEFLRRVQAAQSGCLVVDSRLAATERIPLDRLSATHSRLPVIQLHQSSNAKAAAAAWEQGAFRVLQKPCRVDELATAIQDALEHDLAAAKRRRYRVDLEHRLKLLDSRERRTLELIIAGHPNKAIERRLQLARRTVERIRCSILEKTRFLSFVELAVAYGAAQAAQETQCEQPQQSPQISWPYSSTLPHRNGEQPSADSQWLCCDLHDGAAQYLYAARLRLQAIEASHEVPPDAKPDLHLAGTLLDAALDDIRSIIAGRSPDRCSPAGLIASLKKLIQMLVDSSRIPIELVETLGCEPLSRALETAAYRILEECLHNAIRHSASDRVRVEIAERGGMLHCTVRDWGTGFDPDTAAAAAGHHGLSGIRRRAEILGGKLSVCSDHGLGTRVSVELPVTTR